MAIRFHQKLVNGRYLIQVPPHVADWDALAAWEVERFASMEEHLRPGDVLFDIGAEQGYLSVIYARFVGGENMVLFEPVAEVWPNIRLTWEANGLPCPKATWVGLLSDHTDLDPPDLAECFTGGYRDDWPEAAWRPELHTATSYRLIWEHANSTPQMTLDDWCAAWHIAPDALTIDVEGAELVVLRGAEHTLADRHPQVWVSIHEDMMERHHGQDAFDLLRYMRSHHYVGEFLRRDHESHWYFR